MCGIIGILSDQPAAPRLVEALKRLEYRGYDSAGIAVLEAGKLQRLRAPGKLTNLDAKVRETTLKAVTVAAMLSARMPTVVMAKPACWRSCLKPCRRSSMACKSATSR